MVSDFRQWNINGKMRYSYAAVDSINLLNKSKRSSAGHIMVLDATLNPIKQIHLLPYKDIKTDQQQGLDVHDFIMLSDEHYIVMANYMKTVANIPACLAPAPQIKIPAVIIQEVKDNKVVWQWDASDYPEFYLNTVVLNKFYDTAALHDYIHINGMTLDPRDSNLIMSFRNQNQLVKIKRYTGEIVWRLGGRSSDFPLTAEQFFLRQHNVTFADSTLMLFDNGESSMRPFSRILEFKLDELRKEINYFKSYKIPKPVSNTQGSVQIIGEDYFIGGGSAGYVLMVNKNTGKIKFEIQTNQISLYRAYLVNSITGIGK